MEVHFPPVRALAPPSPGVAVRLIDRNDAGHGWPQPHRARLEIKHGPQHRMSAVPRERVHPYRRSALGRDCHVRRLLCGIPLRRTRGSGGAGRARFARACIPDDVTRISPRGRLVNGLSVSADISAFEVQTNDVIFDVCFDGTSFQGKKHRVSTTGHAASDASYRTMGLGSIWRRNGFGYFRAAGTNVDGARARHFPEPRDRARQVLERDLAAVRPARTVVRQGPGAPETSSHSNNPDVIAMVVAYWAWTAYGGYAVP